MPPSWRSCHSVFDGGRPSGIGRIWAPRSLARSSTGSRNRLRQGRCGPCRDIVFCHGIWADRSGFNKGARALRRPIPSAADRTYRHARANPRGGGVLQGLLCRVPTPGCVAIPASMHAESGNSQAEARPLPQAPKILAINAQAVRMIDCAQSPILSPDVSSTVISIASRHACASVITDRLWPVLLDMKIAKARSDRMSKPLPAIHHVADVILVPGEGSRIGNVTGGRKLARHNFFYGRPDSNCTGSSERAWYKLCCRLRMSPPRIGSWSRPP